MNAFKFSTILVFKKTQKILVFVSFFTCFLSCLNAYPDDLYMPLIDKVDRAKGEFRDLYKYFLKQDSMPEEDDIQEILKKDNLSSNIVGNILENAPVLLNIIELVSKKEQNSTISSLLLRKLNRYLYLEFRHFVGHLNVNKKYEGRLVGLLHDLYKFKVPIKVNSEKIETTKDAKDIESNNTENISGKFAAFKFPFQTTLSKAMIFMLIVNASRLGYDEKVENMAYFLDKIRRELFAIREQYESCNLRSSDIKDFIELLQTYATKEPILGPNYLKYILIAAVILGVGALVAWYIWAKGITEINKKIGEKYEWVEGKLTNLVEKLGEHVVVGALKSEAVRDVLSGELTERLLQQLDGASIEREGLTRIRFKAPVRRDANAPAQPESANLTTAGSWTSWVPFFGKK